MAAVAPFVGSGGAEGALIKATFFNAYGEAPGCNARGHCQQNWAESLEGIYEDMQIVTGLIHRW